MSRLTKTDRYGHYYTNEKVNSRTSEFDCYDSSVITKLGQLEDIEEEFLNYNIDMTLFLKQVLNELKQQPTLEINNFNPEFQILRDDFTKKVNKCAKVVL